MADAQDASPTAPPVETAATPTLTLDLGKWTATLAAARNRRETVAKDWKENVNYRVMRPGGRSAQYPSNLADRVALPEDWARSKQKTAQLSYQLPKIVALAKRPEFEASTPVVTAAINDVLARECRAAYTMDEVMADVINAAGLMVAKVGVDARYETIEVPRPDILGPDGLPMPDPQGPEVVTQKVYQKFYFKRVSPGAFLWPAEFTGSDWDEAPWLGHDTYYPLEEARKLFNLPPTFKASGSKPLLLSEEVQEDPSDETVGDVVRVTELWYKAALYDPEVRQPEQLRRLVLVEGLDRPVVHEDTDWQVWTPATPPRVEPGPDGQPKEIPGTPGHFKGLTKFPIRVGTLVYVSDLATPPSDSEVGRVQVREMMRSRSQMLRQRDSAIPIRWYDVNRIDDQIIEQMRSGEWQDMIPVNGPGERVIGEVARANYPRENFQFESVISFDLDRAWSLSNNQVGTPNATTRSATEIAAVQSANATRLDYEKARTNRFLTEAAEVLFSLMQLFLDGTQYIRYVDEQGVEQMTAITTASLAGEYLFEFKADTSDRIDLGTRQANALKLYNIMAKSPTVNRLQMEKDIIELHGFDPRRWTVPPPEEQPEAANLSFRFAGQDMTNPIAVATMLKSGLDLGPTDIQAAVQMIRDAMAQLGTPAVPPGAPAPALPPGAGPSALPPPGPPPTTGAEIQPPEAMSPILKRAEDGSRLV